MGYYSDTRIMVSKKGYEELEKYVKYYVKDKKPELTEEQLVDYNLLCNTDVFKTLEKQVYIGWNSLKWYQGSYIDVDAIMKGLYHLADSGYSYRYARLGESYDDYEELSNDGDLDINNDIDLDYPYMERYFNDEVV